MPWKSNYLSKIGLACRIVETRTKCHVLRAQVLEHKPKPATFGNGDCISGPLPADREVFVGGVRLDFPGGIRRKDAIWANRGGTESKASEGECKQWPKKVHDCGDEIRIV